MPGLRNTLGRIRKASPKAEKALARVFLHQLAELCESPDQRKLAQKAEEMPSNILLWQFIDNLLEDLNKNRPVLIMGDSASSDEIYEIIKNFSEYAQSRRVKVEQISWMASTHNVNMLSFYLSKLPPRQISYSLCGVWKKFREKVFYGWSVSDEDLHIDFNDTKVKTILSNIEIISNILDMLEIKNRNDIHQVNTNFSNRVSLVRINVMRRKLEALRIITLLIHESQTRPEGISTIEAFPLHDFEHCPLCWRLVPKDRKRNSSEKKETYKNYKTKKYSYCDTHDHTKIETRTQYHKALNLPCTDKEERSKQFLPENTIKILKNFTSIASDYEKKLSAQEWFEARCSPMAEINLEKYPQIEFNLELIWDECKNVLRYIEEHGGNPRSPESILEILDPFTRDEEQNGKEMRIALHKLFSKNFALYFPELAMAETFLAEYNAQWDGRTHGGKRPNSGGARPGAGRRPKPQ